MKALFLLLISVLLISCAKEEEESLFSFNPQQDEMAWQLNQLPVKMKISENFDEQECQDIFDVVQKWEDAAGCKLIDYQGKKPEPNLSSIQDYFHYDADNGVYRPKHYVKGLEAGILAACQCYIELNNVNEFNSSYFIKHADIILNDYHYDFNDGGGQGKYDLHSLLLHEFGHFFGLLHKEGGIMGQGMSSLDIEREIDPDSAAAIYDKYHEWSSNQQDRSPASVEFSSNLPPLGNRYRVIFYQMADGKVGYHIEPN